MMPSSPAKSASSIADMAEEDASTARSTHSSLEVGSTCQMRDDPLDEDPLDPRKVALDIFEVYCHEMITTTIVERRASLLNYMKYMLKRLIMQQYDYGRLYNRTLTANIVSRVCGRHAYEIPDEVEKCYQSHQPPDCLVDSTPDRWRNIIVEFEKLRESLLRKDAAMTVLPSQLKEDDVDELSGDDGDRVPSNDNIDKSIESQPEFQKGYCEILDLMKFHTCLSHLQPQLEAAMDGEEILIPRENIMAFKNAIEEKFGDEKDNSHAYILWELYESMQPHTGDMQLKSFSEIKQVCAEHPHEFDLRHFQHKFLQLIRRWTDLVLPVPKLSKLNYCSADSSEDVAQTAMAEAIHEDESIYGVHPEIGKTRFPFEESTGGSQQGRKRQKQRKIRESPLAACATSCEGAGDDLIDASSEDETEKNVGPMEVLKSKRRALMKNVKDPLDKSIAVAKSARTRQNDDESEGESVNGAREAKTSSFLEKKKSAAQLYFTESDSSEGEGAKLSNVPAPYKHGKHVEAHRDIHVSTASQTGTKRRPFTEDEDRAILKGIKKFGVGKWEVIRIEYPLETRHRTAVQLKDRWRTIQKQQQKRKQNG